MNQATPLEPAKLFDLTGQFAIVTGSPRGISSAIAEALVGHGACFVLSSCKLDGCQAAAELAAAAGEEALAKEKLEKIQPASDRNNVSRDCVPCK